MATVFLVALIIQYDELTSYLEWFQSELAKHSKYWGFVLIPLYCIVAVIGLPVSPITVGAGMVYGFYWGSLWMCLAIIPSLYLMIYLLRAFGSNKFRVKLNARFESILLAFETKPNYLNFLLRLSGITPFAFTTYLLALSKHSIHKLTAYAVLGTLPHKFLQVSVGAMGVELLKRKSIGDTKLLILALGLLVFFYVIWKVKKIIKLEIKKPSSLSCEKG